MEKHKSPTLKAMNLDYDTACARCTNASWEAVEYNEQYRKDDYNAYTYIDKTKAICCWCMIKHCYIESNRIYCDNCTTPIELSEFIENYENK